MIFNEELIAKFQKYKFDGSDFWSSLIYRICNGESPYGTRINQQLGSNMLFYKDQAINLDACSISELIEFFENQIGLKIKFVFFKSWKEIKKKIIKDNIIQEFVNRCAFENDLQAEQKNYLHSLIQLNITLKKILPENIILDTGVPSGPSISNEIHTYIREIRGLHIQPTGDIVYDLSIEVPELEDDNESITSESEDDHLF